MRLDSFIIGDAATADSGKFNVLGGGFTRYEVPMLPFPLTLGCVIRMIATDDELIGRSHILGLTLRGPTGGPNIAPLQIETGPQAVLDELLEGEQRVMQLVVTIPGQAIRLGLYHVELEIDGEQVASIPLPVVMGAGENAIAVSATPRGNRAARRRPQRPPAKPQPKRKPKHP
jgi:hypothetical protein